MSKKGKLSLEEIKSEIRDWAIILIPYWISHQETISNYIQTNLHISATAIAFTFSILYFLYQKMMNSDIEQSLNK